MQLNNILIFAELKDQKINPVFYELLTKAKELAEISCAKGGCLKISGLLLGSGLDAAGNELKASGVDEVFLLDDERLAIYHIDYYCAAISHAVSKLDPDVVFFGATSIGEELAPTMGVRLKTGVAAHCMDIKIKEDGKLAQLVPAFGGKVVGEIFTPSTRPQIISVKPGILSAAAQQTNPECRVIPIDQKILDGVASDIEALSVTTEQSRGISIDKAQFVVCAGYGISDVDSKEDLDQLAKLLNGAVGYTRPAIDAGLAKNEDNLIGTSGKSVRPKVYLGVGVSGSTHHICGMKDSDLIISINTDPNADLFQISDYKAVGDGAAVIKELVKIMSESE